VAAVVAVAGAAPAAAAIPELGGGLVGDFNAGADTLVTLQFADGSNQEIKGGNGLILAVGGGAMFFEGHPHRLETLLSIGLKFSTMQPASNADLTYLRLPIELLAFYRNDDLHFRVGGGPAFYLANSLTGSGAASSLDVKFAPAVGAVAQADFVFGRGFVGLRYTHLNIRPTGTDVSVSASSIGVSTGFYYQFAPR